MVKKRTTIMIDDKVLRAAKALGYNISGLVDRILRSVLADIDVDEIIEKLIEEVALKAEALKQPTWVCACGSTKWQELNPIGDMRVIMCARCKKRYILSDGKWKPVTYEGPSVE